MAQLKIGAIARSDLVSIRWYSLKEFGLEVADTYFRGFRKVFDLLRSHPFAGVSRADIAPEARSYPYRRHRILYRIEDDMIIVVRVLHHAQSATWPK